jgi:hypothetical protein
MRLLRQVTLDAARASAGKTRHSRNGVPTSPPASLRIATDGAGTNYYLLDLDAAGKELSDTWHESEAAALSQAQWEFGVDPMEWRSMSD